MEAIAERICAEGITGKQVFIKFYRVKGGIAEESFWTNQRMCADMKVKYDFMPL